MSNLPPVAHVSVVQHLYVFALLIHWGALHVKLRRLNHGTSTLHRQHAAAVRLCQSPHAHLWSTNPPSLSVCARASHDKHPLVVGLSQCLSVFFSV